MSSSLSTLALPLEDCKRIPEGYFSESALVWTKVFHPKDLVELPPAVVPRKDVILSRFLCPAPTLEEILENLKLYKYLPACHADVDGSYFTTVKWEPYAEERWHRCGCTAVESAWNTWLALYKLRESEKEMKERERLNSD